MSWYVLAIQAQRHRKVREKLDAINVTYFYPMQTIWRKRRGRQRYRVDIPLIPSYLFVECDLAARSARSILSIDGIINFLGYGRNPAPCDADQFAALYASAQRGDHDETAKYIEQLIVGMNVPIAEGPFEGYIGTIMAIKGEIATVDIQVFGRSNAVKIHVDKLATAI